MKPNDPYRTAPTRPSCAGCHEGVPEFFSNAGEPVCRSCFSRQQIAASDARAASSISQDPVGAAISDHTTASPSQNMLRGAAVMLGAVALAFVAMLVTGRVYFAFALPFGAGFVLFARGFAAR